MFETYKLVSKFNNARKRKIHYIRVIVFYANVKIISLIFSFILYFHTIMRFLCSVIWQMSRTFPLILLSIISLDFRLRHSLHYSARVYVCFKLPRCSLASSTCSILLFPLSCPFIYSNAETPCFANTSSTSYRNIARQPNLLLATY